MTNTKNEEKQPGLIEQLQEIWTNNQNQIRQISDELETQSDRGVAIIGALAIENALDRLLKYQFVNNTPPSSLRNFSAKIQWAYALGLISRDERREIEIIRVVRNRMAHELEHSSFTDERIHTQCARLTFCELFYQHPDTVPWLREALAEEGPDGEGVLLPRDYVLFPHGDDARERFHWSVKGLLSTLAARILAAQADAPEHPEPFRSPVALAKAQAEAFQHSRNRQSDMVSVLMGVVQGGLFQPGVSLAENIELSREIHLQEEERRDQQPPTGSAEQGAAPEG